jgi:hypothetical protein
VSPQRIVDAFARYVDAHDSRITRAMFEQNLVTKKADPVFAADMTTAARPPTDVELRRGVRSRLERARRAAPLRALEGCLTPPRGTVFRFYRRVYRSLSADGLRSARDGLVGAALRSGVVRSWRGRARTSTQTPKRGRHSEMNASSSTRPG